jgi:hypothetical protein
MGQPPQRRLEPARYDGYALVRLAALTGIRDDGLVRARARRLPVDRESVDGAVGAPAQTGIAPGGVLVLRPRLAVGRILADHRIDGAAGDEEREPRPAERPKSLDVGRVGPRYDADGVAEALEPAADERRAERRMVDVGVARDDNEVDAVLAASRQFSAGSG